MKPFEAVTERYARQSPAVRKLFWVVLVLLLAAGATVTVPRLLPNSSCGVGVEKRGDDVECTGVTDGAYHFIPEIGPVSDRIKAENDRVTGSGAPYSTIALMIPMTPTEQDTAARTQLLREVQGAYLAQFRANQEGELEPPIRLVLANPGREMTRRTEVTDQLAAMSASDRDRLRAVFGFNVSTTQTEETIRRLTEVHRIAVVGGPITADSIANTKAEPDKYPGLAKIVPSNSDQARALTHYLKVKPAETFLVEDTRADDLYARSLRAAFRTETKGTPFAPEEYRADQATPNDFAQMVNNLCNSRATTVYFSGRPPALTQLVRALGKRGCPEKRYRVVTVSGASTLALDPKMPWEAFTFGAGLSVEYATITHQDAWTARPPATGGSSTDYKALERLVTDPRQRDAVGDIGPTGLADGRTITTHDSALTAIAAIRNRVVGKGRVPDQKSIPAAWPRLHGQAMVRGASGWICLNSYGTPYNKAVAIVKLLPAEGHHIQFVRLAWPDGAPPKKECTAKGD
ncbi:ABC transporter substrate-binding protein [Streptomyces sp. NPDC091272]|uniref:ABC transporter substrate-binding protein n=1 Tax=Streptomyces sp. NPDC091272 TaxID=3365981 RepID=UPI003829AE88